MEKSKEKIEMPRVLLSGQKITPSTWPDGIKESRQIQDPAGVGHLKMHSALPFYFSLFPFHANGAFGITSLGIP
jgi:hypothetical protein